MKKFININHTLVAIERIKKELQKRLKELKDNNKLLAAERLEQRTNYDIEIWK